MLKCSNGKNICEVCKKNIKNDNFNFIDFKEKDYKCLCNKQGKKYINYCFNCNKNICIYCSNAHKEHEMKKFSKIYKIGKEKKNI